MAKILMGSEWYYGVEPGAMYEEAFGRVLVPQASRVFPGYVMVPFQRTVYNDISSARPDYALVDCQYREWWVVELEMSRHSLKQHVLPQVEVLSSARYAGEEAGYVASRSAELDFVSVREMFRGQQPRVLVVADRPVPEWLEPLTAFGARLAVFEIFRSEHNRFCYRVNGFLPSPPSDKASLCWIERAATFLLRVASPGAVCLPAGGEISVEFGGRVTTWTRLSAEDGVWLVPHSAPPLEPGVQYRLTETTSGALILEVAAQ